MHGSICSSHIVVGTPGKKKLSRKQTVLNECPLVVNNITYLSSLIPIIFAIKYH